MLFFQAGLLAGYLYAHSVGFIGLRTHTAFHMLLVVLACWFLPPLIAQPSDMDVIESPIRWLLVSLVTTVGLPYLVLAASSPLLQLWLGRSDPYYLYAASNAGSLIGLLAYPFLLEPLLSLRAQSYVWSGCFGAYAIATAACAVIVLRRRTQSAPIDRIEKGKAGTIGWRSVAKWLFLAFLPSSLLLSVTVHLTADIASVPLLWIAPLGLYLATYIFAFSAWGRRAQRIWLRWLPLVVLVLVIVLVSEATEPPILIIVLHLLGLLWIGMVCHGELARSHPSVSHLTVFYLCIAAGGAAGGVFNGLIAPALFNSVAEYPAALVLACFVPMATNPPRSDGRLGRDIAFPVILAVAAYALALATQDADKSMGNWKVGLIFGVPLVICYTFSERPIRFGLGIAGILVSHELSSGVHGQSTVRLRSFFGVHRITHGGGYRTLVHGSTEHGRQSLELERRGEPLAYYSRTGPPGEIFGLMDRGDARAQDVAVLGLGSGSLAAYARSGQHWTFYEIDPSVILLAREQFTFLYDATTRGANVNIVQGDGRFRISRAQEKYGLIILDAFSSDSIPTHLFTREAFASYRDRLTPNGMIVVHYSSRYFELQPVLGRVARSATPPLMGIFREDLWLTDTDKASGKAPSKWAILFQGWSDPLLPELNRKGWLPIKNTGDEPAWTDNYANVLGALRIQGE